MPYAVVETIGDAANKKLLVVPESWIVGQNHANGYLCWPNVKSVRELNELMANENVTPSALWKKQTCKIIYQSIPSLTSAKKTLEILQKQYTIAPRMQNNDLTETNQIPITNEPIRKARMVVVEKNQQLSNVQEQSDSINPQQDEDPFGNLPDPPLAQTALNVVSTEQMYAFCSMKEEDDPFGDLPTSSSNPPTENNSTRNKLPPNSAGWAVGEDVEQNDDAAQEVTDPLAEVKHSPQVYDLINELKRIIISNQEEVKQNIREGFSRMQETLTSLIKQNQHVQPNTSRKLNTTADRNEFNLDILKTVKDVKRFEDQLKDAEYRKKLKTFIDTTFRYETSTGKRMKLLSDMLFDPALLSQFNWSGKYGKQPLKGYFNIRSLFEYIGTTPTHRANQVEVSTFFINTIQNIRRVPFNVASKSTSGSAAIGNSNNSETTKKNTKPSVENEGAEQNHTMEEGIQIVLDGIIAEGARSELDEGMEHDENVLNEGNQLSQDDSIPIALENSLVEKNINRIACLEELDAFESQLNDLQVQQQVQNWIEETVGLETNVEKRLIKLLDRLIDKNVLRTFSWMDETGGKRPLLKYQNFVKLFEYASRTMIHQTVLFNHGYVCNFFMNYIKELCRS